MEETVEGVEEEGANKPEEPTVAPPKKKSRVKASATKPKKKGKVTGAKSLEKNLKKLGDQKKTKGTNSASISASIGT
jgi:hypothetical protein